MNKSSFLGPNALEIMDEISKFDSSENETEKKSSKFKRIEIKYPIQLNMGEIEENQVKNRNKREFSSKEHVSTPFVHYPKQNEHISHPTPYQAEQGLKIIAKIDINNV